MTNLEVALRYADKGLFVLPMKGKQPLIKFKDMPALTADQIKTYWNEWPDADIALRTVQFFVVDIDTKQAHGNDAQQSIEQLPNGTIIPTLAQSTASGGKQLFYMKPTGGDVKQVIGLLPGVDIKAHVNNYVVVPPSTTDKGQYHWLNKSPIKSPSTQLMDLINSYHPHHSNKPFKVNYSNLYSGKRWDGRLLDELVVGADKGQRNDYLTRLIGKVLHTGADPATAYELINIANSYNHPPLPDNEVNTIFNSILESEVRQRERNATRR